MYPFYDTFLKHKFAATYVNTFKLQVPLERTRKRKSNYTYSITDSLIHEIHRLYILPHRT